MGATAREEGILKLVHPGRHVEIHTEPISAAEILRRNPRHSIARPDVFENPWRVVKPEAILHPGKVFLIVPNHTIYRLLKAGGHHSQSSSPQQSQSPKDNVCCKLQKETSTQQSQSPKNHVQHRLHKQTLPHKSYAGMTPRHQSPAAWEEASACSQGQHPKQKSQVKTWPEVDNYIDSYQQLEEEKTPEDLMKRLSFAKEHYYRSRNISDVAWSKNHEDGQFSSSKQVTKLKTCLRKPNSIRKSLPLRVHFLLPNEDDKRQKRVLLSPTEHS